MSGLVDIVLVVALLCVGLAALLGSYVLVASLLKSQDVSQRFFSSRRFLPVRILRFFSKRRYVDTADPRLVRLGAATVYLAQIGVFFVLMTAFLVFFGGLTR
ncbi:MAG: hypothetical protein MUE46_00825 [Xanthomonadales bacterium]|jgi:hypothetical protein|nr:hypothetical protein [Xanthomonadales bacterium]